MFYKEIDVFSLCNSEGNTKMDEDMFKEEDEFFCSICGKKLIIEHEINEEICHICLTSICEDNEKRRI